MMRVSQFLAPILLFLMLAACVKPVVKTPQPEPVATPTPAHHAPAPEPLPAPTLFDIPWDDDTLFAHGLIPAEQAALSQLTQASVYHLVLDIADDMTHVRGQLEVRYTNTESVTLNDVIFRLFPNILGGSMTVDAVAVNGQGTKTLQEASDSVLRVALPAPLTPGDSVVIAMTFQVTVPTTPGNNYAVLAYMDDVLAYAHAYPMIPAYDDTIGWYTEIPSSQGDVTYGDIAYYLVRVTLPAGQIVAASGYELSRSEQNGRETLVYVAGPMRDFYLASSQRYAIIEDQVGKTTVRAYAPEELTQENQLALRYAADALATFNDIYGIYPFTEMDVVGTPTLAGGIEYPGIVAIALTLYDPEQPFFEVATAHEVGHQWFYSVVGDDQIHHPWLDESLTQYNTALYFGQIYGPDSFEQELENQRRRWNYVDHAAIALDLPVSAYSEATYGGIIYGRGGLFFDEMRKKMGNKAFEKFQKTYYETFKWRIATTADLKATAEAACQCKLDKLFDEWVYPKE